MSNPLSLIMKVVEYGKSPPKGSSGTVETLPSSAQHAFKVPEITVGKPGKLSMFNFWDDAPLKPWVPGKALAEASFSSKMASGSSKTPNSTSWTPGSPWIPGKALAEAAQSHDQPGKEKTRT